MEEVMMWRQNRFPRCIDRRDCFARVGIKCSILQETYKNSGDCPFCKPLREVSHGRIWPWNEDYGKKPDMEK